MRLKRVRVFGFKTFADRTEFDLDGGIVAVVGPNGCGKSNLVDAILWGLGEGNARHLRAQNTQDVIFSGSEKRKPVGFAEVSLLFDNEDGALPIDAPEVTILRRLNRAGESEYSINRQVCRLRDIYDLLADSGLGRSGYAIVGQKEIDAALSASAIDRRAWVDEAAGVQRYRLRKNESVKRLEAANDHLNRVTDIISELENQREPLREEAELALRYKNLSVAMREIELGMLSRDLHDVNREIGNLEQRVGESVRLMNEESALAEAIERRARLVAAEISTLEDELEGLRSLQQGSLTSVERADAEIRVTEQKLAGYDDMERTLGHDAEVTASRICEARTEQENATKELAAETESLRTLRDMLSGADGEAKRLAGQIENLDRQLITARNALAARLKRDAERAQQKERLRHARREMNDLERTLPDLQQGIADAEQAVANARLPVEAWETKIKQFEIDRLRLRKEDEEDAQAVRTSLGERSSLEGRRRGIEATIEAHEGLSQGSKAVVEAAARGLISGSFIPVGQAIESKKDLALAIETALGASANDLIVEEDRDAKRAIAWLKENRAGRATFQPISLMRPPVASSELSRISKENGVLGRANELVECEARVKPVVDSLLGRVLIVESLDVGLRLAKTSGWSRMVSLEGEVVHNSGAVTGGQTKNQGYGFVQRRADLLEIDTLLAKLDKLVAEHDRRGQTRTRRFEQLSAEEQAARNALLEARDEHNDAQSFFSTLVDELRSTEKSRARLTAEIEQLSQVEPPNEPAIDVPSLESERDGLLKKLAARSSDAEQAETRLREAEVRHRQAAERLDHSRRRLGHAEASDEIRRKRISSLQSDRESARNDIAQKTEERDRLLAQRAELDERVQKAQQHRRDRLQQSMELAEQAKTARETVTAIAETLHQAELNRARVDLKRAAIVQRLLEEYGLSEMEALARSQTTEVPDDAASVVNRMRREMRAMGEVNLGAIEAYDRLSQRYEELAAQRDDIQQGILQVRASITELDKLTKDKFSATFELVAEAFRNLFQKLFGGGEGRLALSDPSNILESGIDLEITLPGKRRQPLNLLSGGERSLCATAFLFALLQVKPSPLVVLDEVDAPLDGRNVERFAGLLTEFVDRSQFIVITHNPATIAVAPIWLGVTMQEPGVSILVPARLPGEKASAYVSSAV